MNKGEDGKASEPFEACHFYGAYGACKMTPTRSDRLAAVEHRCLPPLIFDGGPVSALLLSSPSACREPLTGPRRKDFSPKYTAAPQHTDTHKYLPLCLPPTSWDGLGPRERPVIPIVATAADTAASPCCFPRPRRPDTSLSGFASADADTQADSGPLSVAAAGGCWRGAARYVLDQPRRSICQAATGAGKREAGRS